MCMKITEGSTLSTWVSRIFLLCLFPSLSRPLVPLHWETTCLSTYMVWTMTTRWSIPSSSHQHMCQIDMRIFYCSNVMVYSTTPPLGTLADWLGDSWTTKSSTAVDDVYTPTRARSCWMLMLSTVAMCKGSNFPRTRCVDSPMSRDNC